MQLARNRNGLAGPERANEIGRPRHRHILRNAEFSFKDGHVFPDCFQIQYFGSWIDYTIQSELR